MARKNVVKRQTEDFDYKPWFIPGSGFGFDDRFIQNWMGGGNRLPGQLVSPSGRRENQLTGLRNATLLKVMDEIAKDQSFHIDGLKKGTEKEVFEKMYPELTVNDDGTWSKMMIIDPGSNYSDFKTKFCPKELKVTCTAAEKASLTTGNLRYATTKTWVQSFNVPENTDPSTIKSRVEGCRRFGFRFVIGGTVAHSSPGHYKTEMNINIVPVTCQLEL